MRSIIHAAIKHNDVRVAVAPSAVLIAETKLLSDHLERFLNQYGEDGEYDGYAADTDWALDQGISHGALLTKFAGQMCYLALDEHRTRNSKVDQYLDNIMSQSHGSITEHVNFTFVVFGIDRAVTHELVRHRAGMAYSQVSQRYVGPDKVRFCMPFECRTNTELFHEALDDMEADKKRYEKWIENFRRTNPQREDETKTEYRKRLQSMARRVLPNWTEAPIVVTGNVRAWRHVMQMRCSKAADVAIREAMMNVLTLLRQSAPELFADFETITLKDGSLGASSKFIKI